MTVAALLEGDREAITQLASKDVALWTALAEHVIAREETIAPSALVHAMLAIDRDPKAWLGRAKEALAQAESPYFSTLMGALRRVRPWLFDGLAAALPPDDPGSLALRFEQLLSSTAEDALAQTRAFLRDLERTGGDAKARADAWMLLARRAHEDGELDEALVAAREARTLDPTRDGEITRREGAILLSQGRVTEALERVHEVLATRGPLFGGRGSWRSRARMDPLEDALDEAATIVTWASHTTPEWVRALGGIAERSGEGWERFERALAQMAATSKYPDDDLEVVERQAKQRELVKTSEAARAARRATR